MGKFPPIYTFHRAEGFYPLHMPSGDAEAIANAECNPGTLADNMRDRMTREGYKSMRRGEEHGRSKLTRESVRAIRSSHEPYRVLAARYGISDAHISRIKSGYVWAWLPQEP